MALSVGLIGGVPDAETCAGVWSVYREVFGDVADLATWREQAWERHVVRAGFRLALATSGRSVVGFAYGYTGQMGQWWTDQASQRLPACVAADWLGGHFEVVELAVSPAHRGTGIGRSLMEALTQALPHRRWLLATAADPEDPARILYASMGWAVLGPGPHDEQVVLGRSWPAVPSST